MIVNCPHECCPMAHMTFSCCSANYLLVTFVVMSLFMFGLIIWLSIFDDCFPTLTVKQQQKSCFAISLEIHNYARNSASWLLTWWRQPWSYTRQIRLEMAARGIMPPSFIIILLLVGTHFASSAKDSWLSWWRLYCCTVYLQIISKQMMN